MTAEKYFQNRNGGKSSKQSNADGEYITPIYAVELMDDYQKATLGNELKKFNDWMLKQDYDGRIPFIKTCIKEYLNQIK